jgi:glycosyltransferase involved in cell wall biosynthesis
VPPEVTIVIPTRNRWHLLESWGLRSALSQQNVDLEVIVVDDGSNDGSAEHLRRAADDRLRVVTSGSPRGVAHARNQGVSLASGTYTAFLDDDDAWSPRKLRTQLDALVNARADFAYTSVIVVDKDGTPLRHVPAPKPASLLAGLLNRNVLIGASNVLALTALVRDVGSFDEELFHLADWDLWIRLARSGTPVDCQETLVAWRYHGYNLTLSDRDATPEFLRIMRKYPEMPGSVRTAAIAGARWRAWALRRANRRWQAARIYGYSGLRHGSVGNLARAVAVLTGEKVMSRARGEQKSCPAAPDWLASFG